MKKDKDKEIIRLLRADARMSNVDMAKELGITEGAVRSRIRKLVESGAIRRFTIETSEGTGRYAVLMAKSKSDTKRMMSDIASLGIHQDAYEISGEYDGCIILHGASVEEIDGKIDRIRKLKSVADTRTHISFRRY
jgi:Lrp/AsnC family transcriptional regulator of lysine biosynthesis